MKLLLLTIGLCLTTFVTCIPALPLPAVSNGPYTADARKPSARVGPHYKVTLATASALTWLNHSQNALLRDVSIPTSRFLSLQNYHEAVPCAVNRHHQMVGFYRGGGAGAYLVILARPFSYQRGQLHFLPTLPDYTITHPVDLNDKGEIVGDTFLGSFPGDENVPAHAVCWIRGKVHDLGTGAAKSINNAANIVGDSGTGEWNSHNDPDALLWMHGYRYDLNHCLPPRSGWVLTTASGIDGRGRIVGYGLFHARKQAFLLTPKTKR